MTRKFKRLLATIVAVTSILPLQAQNEALNWYFGESVGLSFAAGPPVAVMNGVMNKDEGCSSISDNNGNLLFYTSGINVWNRNHSLMPNGFGLMGHESSSQAALIVPRPGSSSLYYIFTTDAFFYPAGLRYSLVDMSLQGGLGDVSSKNVLLHTPSTEKLSAVRHSNGTDFWLISHRGNSGVFDVYPVTAAGIGQPISTSIRVSHSGGGVNNTLNAIGCMKASPDGTRLALCMYNMGLVELFSFNPSSGIISNAITFPAIYPNIYGVEFSPDNSLLYFSTDTAVFQADLNAGNSQAIVNSAIQVGSVTLGPFGEGYLAALQLAPDKKIYVASFFSEYLCAINFPNARGVECGFVVQGVYLGGRHCYAGLPGFVQSWFNTSPQASWPQDATQFRIQLFPNPFNESFEVLADGTSVIECSLLSSDGRLIWSFHNDQPASHATISGRNLAKGPYLLRVRTEAGTASRIILKE